MHRMPSLAGHAWNDADGGSTSKIWSFKCDVDEDPREFGKGIPQLPRCNLHIPDTLRGGRMLGFLAVVDDDVPTGYLAFVESNRFQAMTGVIILFNCIIIGLETDLGSTTPFLFWSEHIILIYFVVELVLRAARAGYAFLNSDVVWGNMLDVAIVLVGVGDMWLLPLLYLFMQQQRTESEFTTVLSSMMRLLRIVRLVRLVKIVKPLYTLAMGIAEAMQGMIWVLVFLLLLLYATAIVATRLIGHKNIIPENASDDASEVVELFGTIGSSMFSLFEIMSCWSMVNFGSHGFIPLFNMYPVLQWFAILFYVTTAWALLAVMTGVVSEKMLAVRDAIAEDDKLRADLKFQLATSMLHDLFEKADLDGSMAISTEEFKAMLMHPHTSMILKQYTNIQVEDLEDLFHWMDENGDGDLSIDEFMKGFRTLNEEFSSKTLLKLHMDLTVSMRRTAQTMMQRTDEAFDRFLAAAREPITRIKVITEQIQRLDMMLCGQADQLRLQLRNRVTLAELRAMEERLSSQIDALMSAVESLDELERDGLVELHEF